MTKTGVADMPLQIRRGSRPAGRPALLVAGLTAALTGVPAAASAHAASAHVRAAARGGSAILGWGSNFFGQLGNGTTADSSKPVFALVGTRSRYTTVRTGQTSLALTTAGRVYTWGDNESGQFGDGTTHSRSRPVLASWLKGMKVTALRGGALFTLALTSSGKVLAWGDNLFGELGDGSTTDRLSPVKVKIPKSVSITAISLGYDTGLALTKSGRVLSWGGNTTGQLGDGSTKERDTPGYVKLPAHTKVTSIAAGLGTGYAVTSSGRLLAWGLNAAGQLGDGTAKDRLKPVQVRLPHGVKVASATAGVAHALALTTDRRVLAWGVNTYGQLGNGSHDGKHVPVFVKLPKGTKVRAVASGAECSMALTATGRILAWGRNNVGQLGNGSTTDSAIPVRMHLPSGFTPTAIGAGWESQTGLAIGNGNN
jgi:alpha-tubulin suppressor-like RCC1 family protein